MTAPTLPLRMTPADWGLLAVLSVLWGGSFFFVEVALVDLPPFTIVLLRIGLAAITLFAALHVMGLRMPTSPGLWASFVFLGFFNILLPFSLLTWGQAQISGSLASILNATAPLFTLLIAHQVTHDDRMTPARVVGIGVGFFGVVVMMGVDALSGLGSNISAQLLCIGAPLCYGIASNYARRYARLGLSPLVITVGQLTTSTLMLIPIVAIVDAPWTLAAPSLNTWLAIAGIALASTALAFLIFFRILATAGATNLQLVTLLIPISAFGLGWAFLGETLAPQHAVGFALIATGLVAIDGRVGKVLRVLISGK